VLGQICKTVPLLENAACRQNKLYIVFCEKLGIEKEKKQNRSGSCIVEGDIFHWSSPLMSHEQSYVY
jgi:hypothetical protein